MKTVKEIHRTYWKYDDFVQPVLTANGTMGGDSFACDQSNSFSSTTLAWRCFNGDSTTESESNRWQINNIKTSSWYWLSWYNPIPLNITSLSVYNSQATYVVKAYKIQASDDNTNWIDIVTGTNTNTSGLNRWVIDMSSNQAYHKYYRIYCQPNSTTSLQVAEIEITANYIAAGTVDDYDYYTEKNVYKAVKQVERHYWKREETEQPWTQPVLSANGTIGGGSFACAASNEFTSSSASYFAWMAFDNNDSTLWENANGTLPAWIEWYNPTPLNITEITFITGISNVACIKNYTVQASDDGNNWVDIYTGTNTSFANKKSITTSLTNVNFYKYWRIYVSSVNSYAYASIWNIAITATHIEETITPGTAEDYDFYTDEDVYKGVNL